MDRPNLLETLSQETLISLQQLEPSPVESPLDLEKQLPNLPPPAPSSRPFGLGLSGSGHGPVYYCKISSSINNYSAYKNLSNPTSTLLLLRLHNLHNISHHQHLHHSSNNPIRPYLRTLPPPYPPLLPIPSHGAPPCHAPSPNTHRIWPHPADSPPQRLPGPLRRLRTLD